MLQKSLLKDFGMNYAALTPVLIKALQEVQIEHLQVQSETQERLNELSTIVESLKNENETLKEMLQTAIKCLDVTTTGAK
jgi:hypothetical protein